MNLDSNKYKKYIITVSLIASVLSVLVIIGWILDVPLLKSVLPGYETMKFNTALCFILISTTLFLQIINNKSTFYQLSTILCLIVLIYGTLSLSQELFTYNLGIDQFFVIDFEAIANNKVYPGRMSPLTAICFILLALAFFGVKSVDKRKIKVAQVLFHIVTTLSFIAILGYLFKVPVFYKLSFLTSVAILTTIAFFMLSIAASLINPTVAFTGLFTGNKIGNSMARKLFIQMLVIILILTNIFLWSIRHSEVSVEFGIALFATFFIIASLFLIHRAANKLNSSDFKKNQAEDNLIELQMLEEEIINYSKDLEYKNLQLVDFCNIVSHDLRSPIANISMMLDFIEQSDDEIENKELITNMKLVVSHVNQIFNELLESVQVRQDNEIKLDTIVLKDSVYKAMNGFESQIKAYQAEIVIDFSAVSIIQFPQKYIDSIFTNLIGNALKYKSPKRRPLIKIKSEKVIDTVVLSFSDNGLGIDMKLAADKIFKIRQIFHQHPEAKGFGLFMTKNHVQAMGGKIWVESSVDKGSTFFIEIQNKQKKN
jgi:signal transduction histidine kinase